MDKSSQPTWFGVHLLLHSDPEMDALSQEIPALARLGVNTIIAEINYNFAFETHPELQTESVINHAKAHTVSQICGEYGINLIPQFQCLGHQSWAKTTFPLLTIYPEFDETPGQYPNNEGIYCRSWCPQHPDVNTIAFDLIDEICDAFSATSIHVGLDEVFLIGSRYCPRCAGYDPGELLGTVVNVLHTHIVKENNLEMLMWGDRLLDSALTGYGEWEAADNGTHSAIDLIPEDIILCDWHYLLRDTYPSIPIFLDKGFQVIPSGWHDVEAGEKFFDYALSMDDPRMLGYLCTTWGKVKPGEIIHFPALLAISRKLGY